MVINSQADDVPRWQCSVKARVKASQLATLMAQHRGHLGAICWSGMVVRLAVPGIAAVPADLFFVSATR
jgi:hypothetical protein